MSLIEAFTNRMKLRETKLQLRVADIQGELLQERLTELELQFENEGWLKIASELEKEFSREGLRMLLKQSRLHYLKNPLIRHAINVQADYVFALGVEVHCESKDEGLTAVTQRFLKDPKNAATFTTPLALRDREVELQMDGNLFLALATLPLTGRVIVRVIPTDQVQEIICNPEDVNEPWYYYRVWTQTSTEPGSMNVKSESLKKLYPAYGYNPKEQPLEFNKIPVDWSCPVYHVKVGCLPNTHFGVPELYAAFDWAKAAARDCEDYATVKRALAKFAWKFSTKDIAKIAAAKLKFNTTLSSTQGETNPPPSKPSMFLAGPDVDLTPFKLSGMAPSPEEGRRLWLMAGAGAGLPETMMSGDVSTGNLATAKTLDRPTELKMEMRRKLWTKVIQDVMSYVFKCAIEAGIVDLPGELVTDEYTGDQVVKWADDISSPADVDWPSLLERDTDARIKSIISAATLDGKKPFGTMGVRTLAKLLLSALGVDDIDEMLDKLELEDEPIEAPEPPPAPEPGVTPPQLQATADAAAKAAGKPTAEEGTTVEERFVAAIENLRDVLRETELPVRPFREGSRRAKKSSLVEVIRKQAGKWFVYSEDGKKLGGPYSTREQAEKRLAQVEYFKHRGAE